MKTSLYIVLAFTYFTMAGCVHISNTAYIQRDSGRDNPVQLSVKAYAIGLARIGGAKFRQNGGETSDVEVELNRNYLLWRSVTIQRPIMFEYCIAPYSLNIELMVQPIRYFSFDWGKNQDLTFILDRDTGEKPDPIPHSIVVDAPDIPEGDCQTVTANVFDVCGEEIPDYDGPIQFSETGSSLVEVSNGVFCAIGSDPGRIRATSGSLVGVDTVNVLPSGDTFSEKVETSNTCSLNGVSLCKNLHRDHCTGRGDKACMYDANAADGTICRAYRLFGCRGSQNCDVGEIKCKLVNSTPNCPRC